MKKLFLAIVLVLTIAVIAPKAEAQRFYSSPAVTSLVTVQSSATRLYGWYIYNPNASACSLDLFTAFPITLGTTVPVASLVIPPSSGANLWIPGGAPLPTPSTSNFFSWAAVTAAGGGTTCGTGMTVNLWYQ